MRNIVLIALNSIAYLLFIYKCFSLIEGMLYGKHYGLIFRLFIGVINAALMVVMALNIPINTAYLITLLLLYAELLVIFRKSLKDTLFVSVAIMMNIMCLRGMVISLFALIKNQTLFYICNDPTLFLGALLVSNILEWIAIYVILHFMRMENLRFTMHNKTQSRYIIIWASLCVLFMFRSSGVYVRDYSIPHMFIDHLSYCFILLLSFYYFLIYTFRINRAAKLREINKSLSLELGKQMQLQSALMHDAIFTTQANLTTNEIISGLEIYSDPNVSVEYDAWFDFARSKIHPDDYDIFFKSLQRQNLLDNFNLGIEPKPFEYRRLGKDNNYHWVRLILRIFNAVETEEVFVFGYAFDIEKEVHERQTLLRSAQTDLYTGLFNKATAESIITEEVRKGAGILLLLDVDNFKSINDRHGHQVGDHVLKHVANVLMDTFRKCDIIGRIGGDEFMVFIKDTTDISIAEDRACELLTQLKPSINFGKKSCNVTVSIGIAVIDEKIDNFSVAYNQVDSALYKAKQNGKNGYVIYGGKTQCSAC